MRNCCEVMSSFALYSNLEGFLLDVHSTLWVLQWRVADVQAKRQRARTSAVNSTCCLGLADAETISQRAS